jgi:hypothetical protein
LDGEAPLHLLQRHITEAHELAALLEVELEFLPSSIVAMEECGGENVKINRVGSRQASRWNSRMRGEVGRWEAASDREYAWSRHHKKVNSEIRDVERILVHGPLIRLKRIYNF